MEGQRSVAPASADQVMAVRARLDSYAILGSARDAVFDRFVFTAAQIMRATIAAIGLMDGERVWMKAQVGVGVDEVPAAGSFCSQLPADGLLMVEDARRDSRFEDTPLVTGPPYIRFFAGIGLTTTDGLRVGVLWVADRAPKTMLLRQTWQLQQLATSVVFALEARRSSTQGRVE